MSHFTRVATKMVDRELLAKSLHGLGMDVQRGGVVRGWGGKTATADLVVGSGSPGYDIGFVRQGKSYVMIADWYGIRDHTQPNLLRQIAARYAYEAALARFAASGFAKAEESVDAEGTVRLVLRRYS